MLSLLITSLECLLSPQFRIIFSVICFLILVGLSYALYAYLKDHPQKKLYRFPYYCLMAMTLGFALHFIPSILMTLWDMDEAIFLSKLTRHLLIFSGSILTCTSTQAWYLFVGSLLYKKFIYTKKNITLVIVYTVFISIFVGFIIAELCGYSIPHIWFLCVARAKSLYSFVMYWVIYVSLKKEYENPDIPVIIKRQAALMYVNFQLPLTILMPITMIMAELYKHALIPFGMYKYYMGIYWLLDISISTFARIYSARKLVKLRFFGKAKRLAPTNTGYKPELHQAVERVSMIENEKELISITQVYFKQSFEAQKEDVFLHLRHKKEDLLNTSFKEGRSIIEAFVSNDENVVILQKYNHLLITDEIEFDAYYDEKESTNKYLLKFLKAINAAVFIPLVRDNIVLAYMCIFNGPKHRFYTLDDQQQLSIYANHVAASLRLLQIKDFLTDVKEVKNLKEEVYQKHKESAQIHEAIDNLTKEKALHQTGVLYYKKGAFMFGNQAATILLGINPNQYPHHPISIALHKFAQIVDTYRCEQNQMIQGVAYKQLQLSGIPHLDQDNGAILTIRTADAADIIKYQGHLLKDPTAKDYLLYLETTHAGQLINELLPSNSSFMLNLKITLLKMALTKKAILLDTHPEDVNDIVSILHGISMKEGVHTLHLTSAQSKHNLCIQLFGTNELLYEQKETPLLEKYHNGTICIKNIDYLDFETQDKIADFIKLGIYTPIKSPHLKRSETRIICTTSQDINYLVDNEYLSRKLYEQLIIIQIPSIINLSNEETDGLIDSLILSSYDYNKTMHAQALTEDEKDKILQSHPASIAALKNKVKMVIAKKKAAEPTEENILPDFPEIDMADPDLIRAARLGRHALKDKKLMTILWHKFKSQSRIAEYLCVNRSSVNRRCKEYGLGPDA